MPIYMDLHIVPGVKARGVAEAHQLDVEVEEQFSCKCMTYWVDELRGHVFCLIDAPSKEAVTEMHTQAHGLVPHRIIEVQTSLVESFLGRVSDPEEDIQVDDGLKVFHDPSFRVLLLVTMQDFALMKFYLGPEKAEQVQAIYHHRIGEALAKHGGSRAEYRGKGLLASFTSATKAVSCALEIREQVPEEAGLRISISAGEPIAKNNNLFGDTIKAANQMCFVSRTSQPVVTSAVAELVTNDVLQKAGNILQKLSTADETFLFLLCNSMEENYQEPGFLLDDYCQSMGVSKSQLYRKTLAYAGLSPNALLKEFRLQKALEQLSHKQHSVAEVSFDNGFTSPSYFTKCFKSRFGLLPLAYMDRV
ncbi:MAG TPA: nickel-binding protein [Flavisolibacter sp.]|jgi:AraC-like DNA-binding protein|nr:nickel-binding protein [Flavisolibacter sp.]